MPASKGLSPEAQAAWENLLQLPLQGHDAKKLAALRQFQAIGEKATYDKMKDAFAMEDREINGVITLWSASANLNHKDKLMIFIHGGGMVVNTRKTQLPFQTAVAISLGVKVVSIEYPLSPKNPAKLKEMQDLFEREAIANNVYPLDDRLYERFNAAVADKVFKNTKETEFTGFVEEVTITIPEKKK